MAARLTANDQRTAASSRRAPRLAKSGLGGALVEAPALMRERYSVRVPGVAGS